MLVVRGKDQIFDLVKREHSGVIFLEGIYAVADSNEVKVEFFLAEEGQKFKGVVILESTKSSLYFFNVDDDRLSMLGGY